MNGGLRKLLDFEASFERFYCLSERHKPNLERPKLNPERPKPNSERSKMNPERSKLNLERSKTNSPDCFRLLPSQ
ncbi:MAG: hypothetical protein LBB73_04700 [Dysgonamonadaceae bacterium]|nr:hypothetical protein [Dysgonamonadaceae bacterium]